jgi:sterol desaturase/sphingolipid hydroxylase (fatty acid hydroxylase superfamily)
VQLIVSELGIESLVNVALQLGEGLAAPLAYPLDPSRRLFWVFLLSSALLVLLVLVLERKQLTPRLLLKLFFNRRYWLHRSTLTDIGCLLCNSMLRAAILVPLIGSHLIATLWVARLLQGQFGDAPSIGISTGTIAVLFTLCFFIAEDLSRFSVHRLLHRWPLLWRFHRLHHSAEILTPLTLHRVHPVEMCLNTGRGLLVFGMVSGSFVYLFGNQLSGLDILGVDILGFLFNLLGANLRHSHIWLSFGPLERWLISPAQHQIHHSSAQQHKDKNFGTCLAIWDQLGGSLVRSGRKQNLRFGLSNS